MKRGLSVTDLLNKKYDTLDFQGEWGEAFGSPESRGVWFIWGNSGNGKSRFVIQLCKELARFGKIAYNSLEEGDSMTLQNAFREHGMQEIKRKMLILCEPAKELSERLKKQKSPDFVIIDSFQYFGLNYAQYRAFKEAHRNKLLIFISHADGKQPAGRSARSVMYDAALKIRVEGYKALSKGRYIGPNGGTYVIWEKGATEYQGE